MTDFLGKRVVGHILQHSSTEVSINNKTVQNYTEINYSAEVNPGQLYGNSSTMVGETKGQLSITGSITIYREEDEILKVVAGLGPGGFLENRFLLKAKYHEPVTDTRIDRLIGCRFTGIEQGSSEGSDPVLLRLNMSILNMTINGLPPFGGAADIIEAATGIDIPGI